MWHAITWFSLPCDIVGCNHVFKPQKCTEWLFGSAHTHEECSYTAERIFSCIFDEAKLNWRLSTNVFRHKVAKCNSHGINIIWINWSQSPDMGKCRPGASRKVPPPKPRVKAKLSLSGRNYFIARHHQAGVTFENSLKWNSGTFCWPGRDTGTIPAKPGRTVGPTLIKI